MFPELSGSLQIGLKEQEIMEHFPMSDRKGIHFEKAGELQKCVADVLSASVLQIM